MRQKTLQETYQKKTPLQHILLRPDTYVGSIQMEKSSKWILREDRLKFSNEDIMFVPALYKIFDQVLVNAADNYARDKKMNLLKVTIDPKQGYVSVHNNGKGIPVEIHKQQKIYVPELIFGHLLTGSNYNDDEKKIVGGRNGYGAKLANIFSHKFIVQCGDGRTKKKFKMQWRKNMTSHGQALIEPYSGKDYTIVTFYPQFKRFGMHHFDDDIISLMRKRAYDMAGLLSNVKVFLNERQIPINNFMKYVDMYFTNNEGQIIKIRDQSIDNQRWQVVVSLSDGDFKQVSFVNSICTSKGGTHVNYITDQIVQRIQQKLIKKDKNMKVKPFQIKNHLWVFINCSIQNPAFDSQTKQNLTLKQSQFGSTCVLSQKIIKDILKTGIVDQIFNQVKNKQLSKLAKLTGGTKKSKLTGIPKLQDANDAGTRNSQKCTLILTQGDSAKSLAMAGLEVIGRDYFGVFPLKGKLLNVRDVSTSIIQKNEQITNLMKIMGLQVGKKYQDLKQLRYGSIMIMSDQDTDGSHIKGLVINFIHYFWPQLFQRQGFLNQFITPLLKVSKGRQVVSFYTMSDFKQWCEQVANYKTWKIKYYKGLGTSTDKEAQEYFQKLSSSRIFFKYQGIEDDQSINLIFNKKNAQKRKQWLASYDPQAVMVYNRTFIGYKQFVDKEFIHFSNEDNQRSIASAIDGFKPGQRKIIFACFKRNLKQEIKVAQLAGYVAEHSAYHHGQMSLTMTIVNMAQSFVGSNNINLLMPNGQFGSRNLGGKDHASARYIFTLLNRITRLIFPQPDDHTLNYIQDDGQLVQPQYYMPIIPMSLVNGCEGIGSGWSTYIPNFNPRQIASMIRDKLIYNRPFQDLNPWFKGYQGQIIKKQDGNFEVRGILEIDENRQGIIHIKQLPICKWTKDYKQFLDGIMDAGDTKIKGLRQYHTKNRVHFQLQMNQDFFNQNRNNKAYLQKFFKLTTSISMKNLVGFNEDKKLRRYLSPKQILQQFFEIRLKYYEKRKQYMLSKLQRDLKLLSNKQKFIIQVVQQRIVIRNIKKIKLVQQLKKRGYTKNSQFPKIKSTKISVQKKVNNQNQEEPEENQNQQRDESKQYNYLLEMPLWNLTYEKVQQIKKKRQEKQNQFMALQKTQLKQLWLADITEFLVTLDKVQAQQEEERKKGQQKIKKDNKGQKAKRVGKNQKNQKNQKKQIKRQAKKQTKQLVKPLVPSVKQVQKQQPQDLLTRVKKQLQLKKVTGVQTTIVAKPAGQASLKTFNNFFKKKQDDDTQISVVLVSKKKNKKKKMNLDSDEESYKQQSEDDEYFD